MQFAMYFDGVVLSLSLIRTLSAKLARSEYIWIDGC